MNKVFLIVFFSLIFSFTILSLPEISSAQTDYQPLAPVPELGIKSTSGENISEFLQTMFKVLISITGVLAVLMIVIGGIQYMTTDAVFGKELGKQRIQAAIGGLILALASWIILSTINTDLIRSDLSLSEYNNANIQNDSNSLNFGELRGVEVPELSFTGSGNNNVAFIDNVRRGSSQNPCHVSQAKTRNIFGKIIPIAYANVDLGSPCPINIGSQTIDANFINWNNPNERISRYFTVRDVTKGQSARIPTDPEIVKNILALSQELDAIREAWGSGINYTSWYRPPAVNKAVGGAARSKHIKGIAVDIQPSNGKLCEFRVWLENNWSGGMGIYNSWVHIDMRGGGGLTGGTPNTFWDNSSRWDRGDGC